MYIISANPEIHSTWVEQFWVNAKITKKGSLITTKVANHRLTITEQVMRRELAIKDAPHHSSENLEKKYLEQFVRDIGYDVNQGTYENRHLPAYWKFLFHIIAHCLSAQKGSFDKLKFEWVGVMACLTNQTRYNFSWIFFKFLQSNVLAKKTWGMYPCFVQLILDYLLKNVPRPIYPEEVDAEGNVFEPSDPHHVKMVR